MKNLRVIWSSDESGARGLTYLVVRTAQLHLVLGVLLCAGIAAGAMA